MHSVAAAVFWLSGRTSKLCCLAWYIHELVGACMAQWWRIGLEGEMRKYRRTLRGRWGEYEIWVHGERLASCGGGGMKCSASYIRVISSMNVAGRISKSRSIPISKNYWACEASCPSMYWSAGKQVYLQVCYSISVRSSFLDILHTFLYEEQLFGASGLGWGFGRSPCAQQVPSQDTRFELLI